MADMTLADMMALTNRNDSFLEGNGILILILFILMFGWGGNGMWGGNAATQGALTRAEMTDGFNTAEIQRNQSDIKAALCATDKEILQNRYDTAIGNTNLQNQINENRYQAALQNQQIQAQMATQCCDLRTAIHAEGEATRALIQQNQIEDLKSELALARNVATNQTQTQNILSTILSTTGRWVGNPAVSPCACYNTCGNGCC